MTQTPNTHEWTGSTVEEAHNLLEAAKDLIEAHMKALAPGSAVDRYRLGKTTPVTIKVSLDLTGLATSAAEVQALNASLHQTD